MKFFKMNMAKVVIILSLFSTVHATNDLKHKTSSILMLGMEMSNMRDMLKSYIMIGAKVTYRNPIKKLKNGIAHYEYVLANMKKEYPERFL